MRTYNMTMPELTSVRGQTLLTDTKPYLFRQSPVDAEMLDDMLTGGTVAWNQICNSVGGNQATVTTSGTSYTVVANGAQSYFGIILRTGNNANIFNTSHKYYVKANIADITIDNFARCYLTGTGALGKDQTTTGLYEIIFMPSATALSFNFRTNNTLTTTSDTATVKDVQVFDLTLMFGTAIADYVLALETQTAGSGIAWLKSFGFFNKDFFPFDAGSLLSVQTSGHKTVGKNLLNAPNINGTSNGVTITQNGNEYTLTGTASAYTQRIETGERVLRAGTYTLTAYDQGTGVGVQLRSTDGLTTYATTAGTGTQTFTLANDTTVKCRIYVNASTVTGGRTVKLQLELGTTATNYEPYESHTYPLSDIELRGIPKLTDGNIVYDGDTYASDGTVTRKYGIVDLGTLNWEKYSVSQGTLFRTQGLSSVIARTADSVLANIICPKYPVATKNGRSEKTIQGNNAYIDIIDSSYSDAATFKSAMSGVYLVYELATPTTETTTPFTNPQVSGTTEEYVDERTVPMPVGHVTEYSNMIQKEQIQMHMGQAQAIKMHMPTV